ncbi:ATP-binding cassette domain-containing protein [Nocardiopsis sp. NPDC006938]|uniref:ATP-binding cassette domain-containing protein n=1 Tax=Nocardiopsis sp. NPDC006938 TaxID=3364337 RepID=UPI0036BE28F8
MHDVLLDDVTLEQYGARLLDGVSLHLEGGRVHGLIGPSGSGKSTLLSMIAGFVPPTRGTVLVGGRPVTPESLVGERVGLVRGMYPDDPVSVRDTLTFAASLRPDWCQEFAVRLMRRFGIPLDRPLSRLSHGERSAVSATLGLAARTPVTLLDECCTGMDAHMRDVFLDEVLSDLMLRPRTLVVATHLVEELGQLFDDVVMLDGGAVVFAESMDALGEHGTSVIGPSRSVDSFVSGLTVTDERELGPVKAAAVPGRLTESQRARAFEHRLDLAPIGLRDLMSQLTGRPRE